MGNNSKVSKGSILAKLGESCYEPLLCQTVDQPLFLTLFIFSNISYIEPAGKGMTSWLSFVVSKCEFVTFPLVSWVKCGT